MKSRRELLLLTAGAAGLAGCSSGGGSGTTPSETLTETETSTSTETETATEEPTETTTEQPENQKWRDDVRSGVPLNGLGAYTDQVLEAGPVRETKAKEIQQLLEETNNLDEEIDVLTEILTNEEFDSYMAEYHRQKNQAGNTENQVVVNKNWSFTSQSEPILELYKVTDGNLQSQPTILDHDPNYNSRNINKPGSEEPQYLAGLRDDSDWASLNPQDYHALSDRMEYAREEGASDEKIVDLRKGLIEQWSYGLFGIGTEHDLIPHDAESSNIVFDGLYHKGDTEAVVELNRAYAESELFDADTVVSAEYTGTGWEFHKQEEYPMGEQLPGRK